MNPLQDVFISYGRADSKTFAAQLNKRLIETGLEVWFDFDDIPLGVDYQKQIDDGIAKADIFLFLIAPHSIHSPYCRLEIELAIKLNKRIIPILHVETIDRATWQQRNPNGTDQEWADYQATGKHSSFTQMHPLIGKINWVYMREGQDTFEPAFAKLLALLHSHRDYVHHHTVLLNQALAWERSQNQRQDLLIGDELHQAQEWLLKRFTTEQAPCWPTDLQCEFITESIKNGHNLMTQVFIAYAHGDHPVMTTIRRYLWREGMTVWTSDRDIPSGTDFQAAIRQGIEGTDTVLYLMSPEAISSDHCQAELDYALSLKKRIIPVMIGPVETDEIPLALQPLQYVNLLDLAALLASASQCSSVKETHQFPALEVHPPQSPLGKGGGSGSPPCKGGVRGGRSTAGIVSSGSTQGAQESQTKPDNQELQEKIEQCFAQVGLLTLLQQERSYFEQHKVLLVKALKWNRQHRNPSILLRGFNLRHAGDWLDQAETHPLYPSTPLQVEFIQASQQQPPAPSLDVFISYSRADSDIARQINDALQLQGKRTWFDQESIAIAAANFKDEIYQGINVSDNIVFILSPRSIASPYCTDEVAYAASLNKRFIPVLYQPIDSDQLPPALKNVQWINFSQSDDDSDPAQMFARGFSQLVRALDTDREHVRQHTQWSQRAIAWDQKQRSVDLLLRGSEFAVAYQWLEAVKREGKQPQPTAVQGAFIEASQADIEQEKQQEQRRVLVLRSLLGVVSVAFAIAAVVGVFAFQQRNRAQQILGSQIQSLSRYSLSLSNLDKPFSGLLEAVRAGTSVLEAPNSVSADDRGALLGALQLALYETTEWQTIKQDTFSWQVAYSPDGQMMAAANDDGSITLWRSTGEFLEYFPSNGAAVTDLTFSPDGKLFAATSEDGEISLWNAEELSLEHYWTVFEGHARAIAFSPDGQTLVSTGVNHPFKVWNLKGDLLQAAESYEEGHSVAFSPDGDWFAIAHDNGTITRWDRQGNWLQTFVGHTGPVWDVAISPDGQTLASASDDQTIRLWDMNAVEITPDDRSDDGIAQAVTTQPGVTQQQALKALEDSPETIGKRVNIEVVDNYLRQTLSDHRAGVMGLAFSPDGMTLASASQDYSLILWNLDPALEDGDERFIQRFQGHDHTVIDVAFSPDGSTLASASIDQTIKLWSLAPKSLPTLTDFDGTGESWSRIKTLAFSPDGQHLIARHSAYEDVAVLWNLKGTAEKVLWGNGLMDVGFRPDGQPLAFDHTDRLEVKGMDDRVLHEFEGQRAAAVKLRLSPDGNTLASVSEDKTIKLWSMTGEPPRTLNFYEAEETDYEPEWWPDFSFSADGQYLSTTHLDAAVRIWHQDGTLVHTLTGHFGDIKQAIFNPNPSAKSNPQSIWVASRDSDYRVKLWTRDGKLAHTLRHEVQVEAIAFHPDGHLLASGDRDGTVHLWNLEGERIQTLFGHQVEIYSLAFSPNGQTLATGDGNDTITLWNLERFTLDTLMAEGCEWLAPYLAYSDEVEERDRTLCDDIKKDSITK